MTNLPVKAQPVLEGEILPPVTDYWSYHYNDALGYTTILPRKLNKQTPCDLDMAAQTACMKEKMPKGGETETGL